LSSGPAPFEVEQLAWLMAKATARRPAAVHGRSDERPRKSIEHERFTLMQWGRRPETVSLWPRARTFRLRAKDPRRRHSFGGPNRFRSCTTDGQAVAPPLLPKGARAHEGLQRARTLYGRGDRTGGGGHPLAGRGSGAKRQDLHRLLSTDAYHVSAHYQHVGLHGDRPDASQLRYWHGRGPARRVQ